VHSGYKEDNWGDPVSFELSVGSQPMKRILRGWCEMAASLGVSRLLIDPSSAWEAMKIEPESMKLKNLHCWKSLPGNSWRRHSRLEKA
jgi:hypothetical protein